VGAGRYCDARRLDFTIHHGAGVNRYIAIDGQLALQVTRHS